MNIIWTEIAGEPQPLHVILDGEAVYLGANGAEVDDYLSPVPTREFGPEIAEWLRHSEPASRWV